MIGGLRSGMGYCGTRNLEQFVTIQALSELQVRDCAKVIPMMYRLPKKRPTTRCNLKRVNHFQDRLGDFHRVCLFLQIPL